MASTPLFHSSAVPLTVGAVAERAGLALAENVDANRAIAAFAPADAPLTQSLVFVEKSADLDNDSLAVCAAILCTADHADAMPAGPTLLICERPRHAFQDAALALFPDSLGDAPAMADPAAGERVGTAWVAPTARLEDDVVLQPGAVVGDDVEIGRGSVIGANTTIARGCRIGRGARIGPGVAIQYALIGDRVSVLAGACIGQEGFGFVPREDGLRRMPQLGRVIIQDDVEIGANTTIDRGALGDTVIGQGTKIDNLVQIAHNVVIGTHTVIAGNCGISGSVRIGDRCQLGGGVGIADHLTIGNDVQLMASSGVMNDIGDGERWGGAPALPIRQAARMQLALRRLADEPKKAPRGQ